MRGERGSSPCSPSQLLSRGKEEEAGRRVFPANSPPQRPEMGWVSGGGVLTVLA